MVVVVSSILHTCELTTCAQMHMLTIIIATITMIIMCPQNHTLEFALQLHVTVQVSAIVVYKLCVYHHENKTQLLKYTQCMQTQPIHRSSTSWLPHRPTQ